MAYRFTDTDKWNDAWFSNLKPNEKLLFNYFCDNCDIAGFIEVIFKNWANDTGLDKSQIEGAFKGLQRGFIISESGDCIFLRNFLKHQKNLPLNEKNKAHLGIMYRFKYYANKFNITDINEFIQGASKGLQSPSGIGIGIGTGLGSGKKVKIEGKNLIPEFHVFLKYAIEKEPLLDEKAVKFKYDAWIENGWKNGNGNAIKNWKSNLNNTIPYIQKKNNNNGKNQPNNSASEFSNGRKFKIVGEEAN